MGEDLAQMDEDLVASTNHTDQAHITVRYPFSQTLEVSLHYCAWAIFSKGIVDKGSFSNRAI